MRSREVGRLLGPVLMTLGLAMAVTPVAAGPRAFSTVQVPVSFDLSPVFEAAEAALPRQAGHWPGWRRWHGIDARYRAWRGPLVLGMEGNRLQARAHVRYQAQARKALLGRLQLSAGCGVDEPPRQALIGALARLDWAPDWSLYPRFRVLPTQFLDRCEVTVADIDVTPLVGRVFEQRIEESLREAMAALAPRLRQLRGEAERAWAGLQTPHRLAPGLWLHLEPLALALAPPQGSGARVETALWLTFRAALSADPRPRSAGTPLPPLIPYRPSSPGLHLALGLALDYTALSEALSGALGGQTLNLSGRTAVIEALSLSARDEDLVLTATLAGDLPGRLTLMARPGFDAVSQSLRLEQVDFVFDAQDPDLGRLADLFYEPIRARIESGANALLAERMGDLRDALVRGLAVALPPSLEADLSGLRIAELVLRPGPGGIGLSGAVQGSLRLGPVGAVAKGAAGAGASEP